MPICCVTGGARIRMRGVLCRNRLGQQVFIARKKGHEGNTPQPEGGGMSPQKLPRKIKAGVDADQKDARGGGGGELCSDGRVQKEKM